MHIHPFKAVFPKTQLIASPEQFFSTVKDQYSTYRNKGLFKELPNAGIYIHGIETPQRHYKGLIACVEIEDYLSGRIRKHEDTLPALEQEQTNLLLQHSAQVKPVMLTYAQVDEISWIVEEYSSKQACSLEVIFKESEETHRFWQITDADLIKQIQVTFLASVTESYIADGHHRSAAAAILFQQNGLKENPYRLLPCAFYPTSELVILDYNRIVDGLNEMSSTVFMSKIAALCEIEHLDIAERPLQKHELLMYLDQDWFRLHWKQEVLQEYKADSILLDVKILNEKVLMEILDITDVRSDSRLKYIGGPKGLDVLKSKTLKKEERLAFCLYPVSLEDFLAISASGGVLPPKSTWFEPRMRSGLVVREF